MQERVVDLVTGTVVAFQSKDIRITDRMREGRHLVCHVDHPHMVIGLLDKIDNGLVYVSLRACYIPVWP